MGSWPLGVALLMKGRSDGVIVADGVELASVSYAVNGVRFGGADDAIVASDFDVNGAGDEGGGQRIDDAAMNLEAANKIGEERWALSDGVGIGLRIVGCAEVEQSVGANGERNREAEFIFDDESACGGIHVENVAFRADPDTIEGTAGPEADGDERAIDLITSGNANVLADDGGGDGAEVVDGGRRSLGVDVVIERAVCAIRLDGESLRGSDLRFGIGRRIGREILEEVESGIVRGEGVHGAVSVAKDQSGQVKNAAVTNGAVKVDGPHGGARRGRNVSDDESGMREIEFEVERSGLILGDDDGGSESDVDGNGEATGAALRVFDLNLGCGDDGVGVGSETGFGIGGSDEHYVTGIGGNGDGGFGISADGDGGTADEFRELIELQEIGERGGIGSGVDGVIGAATLGG